MVARRRTVPGPKTGDLSHEPETNSGTQPVGKSGFASDQLLSFIERYERITEEIEGLQDDRKEIMSEAKGTGFDTKIMRMIIRERKMDKAELQERDAVLDLYRHGVEVATAARYKKSLAEGGEPQD